MTPYVSRNCSILAVGSFSMSAVTPCSPTVLAGPVHVRFQLGLFREEVLVPAGNLSYRHARRLATEVIERKVNKPTQQGLCVNPFPPKQRGY